MHPVKGVIDQYLLDFPTYKSENEDLSNLNFHKTYGFSLVCPTEWPLYESLSLVCSCRESENIVVIYPSTSVYDEISSNFSQQREKVLSTAGAHTDQVIEYFAWQELFYAMQVVNEDTRHIKQLKGILTRADLVIFLGSSTASREVVNQVQLLLVVACY